MLIFTKVLFVQYKNINKKTTGNVKYLFSRGKLFYIDFEYLKIEAFLSISASQNLL